MFRALMKAAVRFSPRFLKDAALCYLADRIPDTATSLKKLKDKGFLPREIIDCGANVGDWTKMVKKIFPDSRVLMIEARPEAEAQLKGVRSQYPQSVDYLIALLGARDKGEVSFYKMESGSSVFEEQSDISRSVISLPMARLDRIVAAKGFEHASLIKLDVQGSELEILRGGEETLKKAEVVLMEVSFLEYNKGAPLAEDVVIFMKEHGFAIYDIGGIVRWRDGALLQADVIFLRKDSLLRRYFFDYHAR